MIFAIYFSTLLFSVAVVGWAAIAEESLSFKDMSTCRETQALLIITFLFPPLFVMGIVIAICHERIQRKNREKLRAVISKWRRVSIWGNAPYDYSPDLPKDMSEGNIYTVLRDNARTLSTKDLKFLRGCSKDEGYLDPRLVAIIDDELFEREVLS
jgi:hypothetical protein